MTPASTASTPHAPRPRLLPGRPLLWLIFSCLMLAVPLSMIARKEYILANGALYRFRVAPVDPYDPFRGRYMNLAFEVELQEYDIEGTSPDDGSEPALYALLGRDEAGFARILSVQTRKPDTGDWLLVGKGRNRSRIQLPFRRFYLNENKAYQIEQDAAELARAARDAGRPNPVHATVRVRDGEGTVTGLQGPDGTLAGTKED